MKADNPRASVHIVGAGLIGREHRRRPHGRGMARDDRRPGRERREARARHRRGGVRATDDAPDLVVVAVPPAAAADAVVAALRAWPEAVVTDVASVKEPIARAVEKTGQGQPLRRVAPDGGPRGLRRPRGPGRPVPRPPVGAVPQRRLGVRPGTRPRDRRGARRRRRRHGRRPPRCGRRPHLPRPPGGRLRRRRGSRGARSGGRRPRGPGSARRHAHRGERARDVGGHRAPQRAQPPRDASTHHRRPREGPGGRRTWARRSAP